MREKSFYLNFFAAIIVVLFVTFITMYFDKPITYHDERPITLTSEKIKETELNINVAIDQLCTDNGVFLCESNESNVIYLILEGTYTNLDNEAPYYSNVKVQSQYDTIKIYFNTEIKKYPEGKCPTQRLIYKITKDKKYEHIKLFRNGRETHFNGVGA